MIQELLGSAGLLSDGGGGGERKYPYFHCGIEAGSHNSTSSYTTPTSIPSTPTTTAATTMATTTITATSAADTTTPTPTSNTNTTNISSSDQPSLRCPRCDSPNTKFCYYNNYNLTQPRHFCKTCRRYWTKGGALRNVPIGGGCRKNKNSTASTATTSSGIPCITAGNTSAASGFVVGGNIIKTSSDNNRNGFEFDHHRQTNPILWSSSAAPQNSSQQLLALLRSASSYSQNTNPNPNNNCHVSSSVKDEAGFMMGSFMGCTSESALNTTTSSLNTKTLNLDPLLGHQVNPIGLCGSSSFWRNNQQQNNYLLQQDNNNHNNEVGNDNTGGIQELYQRLRSSTNYYNSSNTTDHTSGLFMNINIGSSTPSSSSSILESAPVASVNGVGDMGYSWMNPQFYWSDLSTATDGSFP
ncbi:hypothetical protein MKX01_005779 [Papaver californicum]|nr:hypothetical protein MKX01_005779 [Papaver californicum]